MTWPTFSECLLREGPIEPWSRHDPLLELGLFCASKTVNRDASLFFYSQNCLNLSFLSERVNAFVETIGRRNADCIQHVYVNFPYICDLDLSDLNLGNISIQGVDVDALAIIESSPKLSTLTTSVNTTDQHYVGSLTTCPICTPRRFRWSTPN